MLGSQLSMLALVGCNSGHHGGDNGADGGASHLRSVHGQHYHCPGQIVQGTEGAMEMDEAGIERN